MTLDLNELLSENQRLSTDGQSYLDNFVKMPEGNGKVDIRLLPPADPGMFDRKKSPLFQATRIHRLKDRSFHCAKYLSGAKWQGDCPICRYYNWLWQESEKKTSSEEVLALQTQARAIKPIERYYYNCIVRLVINPSTQDVAKNVGPKILSVGKTLHKMIVRAIVGDESLGEKGLGDVTDPSTGRDFRIIKQMRQSGREAYPNYSDSKFLDVSPLGDPEEIKAWKAACHDLVALRVVLDNEELKKQLKMHLGLIPDEQTQFDPREYQPGHEPEEVVVREEPRRTPTPAPAVAVEAEGGDITEPLPDEDFLSELRDIS